MDTKAKSARTSTDLRYRLSVGAPSGSTVFVEVLRDAARAMRGGTKRHRLLYQAENFGTAIEGFVIETLAAGSSVDEVQRFRDALTRAVDDLLRRARPLSGPRSLHLVAREELEVNRRQDLASWDAVLPGGTLSDVERAIRETDAQIEVSRELRTALSERARLLRAGPAAS